MPFRRSEVLWASRAWHKTKARRRRCASERRHRWAFYGTNIFRTTRSRAFAARSIQTCRKLCRSSCVMNPHTHTRTHRTQHPEVRNHGISDVCMCAQPLRGVQGRNSLTNVLRFLKMVESCAVKVRTTNISGLGSLCAKHFAVGAFYFMRAIRTGSLVYLQEATRMGWR